MTFVTRSQTLLAIGFGLLLGAVGYRYIPRAVPYIAGAMMIYAGLKLLWDHYVRQVPDQKVGWSAVFLLSGGQSIYQGWTQ